MNPEGTQLTTSLEYEIVLWLYFLGRSHAQYRKCDLLKEMCMETTGANAVLNSYIELGFLHEERVISGRMKYYSICMSELIKFLMEQPIVKKVYYLIYDMVDVLEPEPYNREERVKHMTMFKLLKPHLPLKGQTVA